MVSSRYGLESGVADVNGAADSLTPESVPDGSVSASPAGRYQSPAGPSLGNEISENLPFGVVMFDPEQNVVYCNPQHYRLLKIDLRECGGIEEWLREGCRDPDYAAKILSSWREHVWRKQLTRVFSLKTRDDKLREIEFRSKLLDDGGLLLTLFDVTESRRSEDALRLTETKFNTVFEHVTIGVALVDRTGRFFEVNPALERMLDFARWELRRMALNELVGPEDYELLRRTERELVAGIGGDERTLPIRFRKKGGQFLGSNVTLSPIRDGGRQPVFTAYFIRDTSGEEEVREDLRESQEQNRALLEAIPDLILLLDGSGQIEDLIPPSNAWRGVPVKEDWKGQLAADVWPAFGGKASGPIQRSLRSGNVESFAFRERREGERSDTHLAVRIAPCGADQAVAVIADESDRAAAREAGIRQGVAFRHLRDAVILTDLRGRILDWNPAASRMFGYSAEEIAGRGLAELYAAPNDAGEFNRRMSEELTRNREWRARTEFFRKDGRSGFGEVLFFTIEDEGCPLSLLGIHREITRETVDEIASERTQHRVRNQLQMVGSLFGLEMKDSAGHPAPGAAMLQKFQARIRAVTRVYEPRVKGAGPGTVRLAAYSRALADDLMRICSETSPESEMIAVFGDESVSTDAEAATPLGLLVAELGLAAFRVSANGGAVGKGALNFVIQPDEAGMPRVAADMAEAVFDEAPMPIIRCLVSQLRGRLAETRRNGRMQLQVTFPGNAE